MDCPLPRERLARIIFSLPRSHFRAAHRVADEARRLAGDRRAWQGIAELPTVDADL